MKFLYRLFEKAPEPGSLSPRCSRCGRNSAVIVLTEESGKWYLRYSGPGGSNGGRDVVPAEEALRIRAGFTEPYDPNKIRAAGFYDDAGFCASCSKFYCTYHWDVSSTGGGTCPAGHFKSLDPHWSPEE